MDKRYRSPRHKGRQVAEVLKALLKNFQSIGTTPDEQLAWLHSFSHRDLSKDAASIAATAEVNALLTVKYQAWGSDFDTAVKLERPVAANEVAAVQRAVCDVLEGLSPGAPVWLPAPVADGLLWHHDNGGLSIVTRNRGVPQVLACLVDLLTQAGPNLRRCENCRRLYILHRARQRYCSKQCGTRFRVNIWRDKNKARHSANRHRQYVRKVRARYPKARIARRSPKGE